MLGFPVVSVLTGLSSAEQAIDLPGSLIRPVGKKYETVEFFSAEEGKDGSLLIAL